MKKYDTFLFDLDGVLIDSDKIHYDSTIEALKSFINYDLINNEEMNNIMKSTITTLDKLYYLKSKNIINDEQILTIYENKKNISNNKFMKLNLENEKILLIKYLKENNIKVGVVTNTNKKTAQILLKNIINDIDILITNEDVNNKKPSPEPYLKAINLLNSDIKKCIIFEDSEIGILSAKNTNCDYFIIKNIKDLNLELIKNLCEIKIFKKYIAHRGNLYGPDIINENKIDYILNVINKGYDCEIDIRYIDNILYLGHDNPDYIVDINFLLKYNNNLWIHCKNIDALNYLLNFKELNIFWHQSDNYTLTSKNNIWCYPDMITTEKSIIVMPELNNFNYKEAYGICSDYVGVLNNNFIT
jgi:beta-phosphoglucomutase